MADEVNITEVADEIKNKSDEELRKTIEEWYEKTRTQGMKLGAQMISAAVAGVIEKNLNKKQNPSLRDYKRMTDSIIKIVSVQIKQMSTEQNNLETTENNDGEESSI